MPPSQFPRLALFSALLLPIVIWSAPAAETLSQDEKVLQEAKVGTDAAGLVAFFRQRTLTDADRRRIEELVRQLGNDKFPAREEASAKLVALGPPSLPFLREALKGTDREMVRRAQECITAIDRGPGSALAAAAVRLLAQRRPPEAIPVLLDYFPFADDEWVESEVLTALCILGVAPGNVDPALAAALKHPLALRRAAAAYVLARAGDREQRATVRRLLEDTEPRVRLYAARGLVNDRSDRDGAIERASDEKILKDAGVAADAAGVLAFLRKRTLSDDHRKQLEGLIEQLGNDRFTLREQACARLVESGPPALPFLRAALTHQDLEVVRRAGRCLAEINRGPGPTLSVAAVRTLVRQQPPEAVATLLGYVPFADDVMVEEEVLSGLNFRSVQQARLDPVLAAALKDSVPARRAAAAYVLGHVGEAEHCLAIRPLLADTDARVRFRAAQGLLAAKDRSAMPVLLALLGEAPLDLALQAEELLQRLAQEKAPPVSVNDPAARPKCQQAWTAWWLEHGLGVDLARLEQGPRHLGLTVVAELDSNRVWECGRDGKPRWQIQNLQGPIDAQVLPGGRVLIAEHQGRKVTERDLQGKEMWATPSLSGNPIACQRLPNGNTFVATYNQVMEFSREGKTLYTHNPTPGLGFPIIYGAHKMRNGHIACISGQGVLLEIDQNGQKVQTIQVANNGGWCSVEGLPNGHFLVAVTNHGKVLELDATGKTVWECTVPGASHATRLANGHTLVSSMNNRRVVEVAADGRPVWESPTVGRPFHVHRR